MRPDGPEGGAKGALLPGCLPLGREGVTTAIAAESLLNRSLTKDFNKSFFLYLS